MINIEFLFNSQIVVVRISGKELFFCNNPNGFFAPIDKLKFSRQGVLKEFPDLKDNKEWRKIALDRFKDKINSMNSEIEITKYLVNDLVKFGYKPLRFTKQGSRTKNIKNDTI
jgi:hypothetical protein